MPTYFKSQTFSVGFDDQTTFDEADGAPSWNILEATRPDVTFARNIETFALSRSSDFEEDARAVGSKHGGTLTFSAPLTSQAAAYDPTSGAPTVDNPLMKLIKDFIGNQHIGSTGSDIAVGGSDGDTWELTSGNLDSGAAYLTGTGSSFAVSSAGFVKSYSTTTQELFEDAIATPANGDDVYPTVTFYAGSTVQQPTFRTFGLFGDDATLYAQFVGCWPQRMVINANAGQTPTVEFTFGFTDYEMNTSDGGLQSVTNYQRVAPLLGTDNARVFINGTSTGTADPDGTCGVTDLQLEVSCEYTEVSCHAASQGVSTVSLNRRIGTLRFSALWSSDIISGTDSIFGNSLTNDTTFSFSLQTGSTAGKAFGFLIPAAKVRTQPGITDANGLLAVSVEAGPSAYSGDSGTGAPSDSILRVYFG